MQLFAKSALAFLTLFVGLTKAQINGTGNLFYFVPSTGACGFTNSPDQYVAIVSGDVFNSYPGATDDPNYNPICEHNLTVTCMHRHSFELTIELELTVTSDKGTEVSAQIVDYYTSSPDNNVGLSSAAFKVFGRPLGEISDVTWDIV
ncbi:predicted protein [Postia placenta Mad-698-R]|uniref:Uncharacterized protein n=1 Tax=Postia placenta MAD-698-R-SB12 TaxID=670580 RepID=A0A1X6MZR5_9APHY|nr:hypothetical protein POSPLADRAFT_1047020 [Postia placenta MAD-698-R-SB12]EED83888.1 predicted protein [Postia placenta Mad-698-R]OSX61740.1 hypothetical protein POSPLADRAFT_1047020 [Postia placenta MAD-698-R-SB12]